MDFHVAPGFPDRAPGLLLSHVGIQPHAGNTDGEVPSEYGPNATNYRLPRPSSMLALFGIARMAEPMSRIWGHSGLIDIDAVAVFT